MNESAKGLPSKEDFEAASGSVFSEEVSGVDFVLGSVVNNGSNENYVSYTLLFQAPADTAAEQRIYQLTNERLGVAEIFLVPVRKDEAGVHFEAVFNQLRG